MKIIEIGDALLIYPFVRESDEGPLPSTGDNLIIQGGWIRMDISRSLIMDPEAARTLAKALLHAAERAKKGKTT